MRPLIISALVLAGAAPLVLGASTARAQVELTVQAEDLPEKKPWTEPATFGFKSVTDGADFFDIALAIKAEGQVPRTGQQAFAALSAIRKSDPSAEREQYAGKVGLKLEFGTDVLRGDPRRDVRVYADPSIGLVQTTTFRDPKAACAVSTPPATCADQRETSIRAELKTQVFWPPFSNAPYYDPVTETWESEGPFFYDVGPVFTVFYDHVLDAKSDATGLKQEGDAAGLQSLLAAAITPAAGGYRWVFRASGRHMTAFSRSGPRKSAFPANAFLFTASVNYEFGVRSFEGRKGWSPSVGLTYNVGDDPLTGRKDTEDTTFVVKVAYSR